ncbi:MAG: hypothetical protein K0S53_368 [Bacteroidetes bacterium]|jgi:hypothetical protein|nr:hypothetical protein [Bacteroidota bacterium]
MLTDDEAKQVRVIIENLKVGELYEIDKYGERMKFKLVDFCRMSRTLRYLNEHGVEEYIYNMGGEDILTIEKV